MHEQVLGGKSSAALISVGVRTYRAGTCLISSSWIKEPVNATVHAVKDAAGHPFSDADRRARGPRQRLASRRGTSSASQRVSHNSFAKARDFTSGHHHALPSYSTAFRLSVSATEDATARHKEGEAGDEEDEDGRRVNVKRNYREVVRCLKLRKPTD